MDLLSSRSLRQSQALWAQKTCGECFARVSATLQVSTPEWFLLAPLVDWVGEVDDVPGVLGVDRVVPIVVRVLVSWQMEE